MDIWRLPAAELASLIKSRKISAKEAATAGLARLDAVNPKINAVVDHRPDDVLAQAQAIDDALARKEDPGPLAGVPPRLRRLRQGPPRRGRPPRVNRRSPPRRGREGDQIR